MLLPDKRFVPVLEKVTLPAVAVPPLAIALLTVTLPAPAKIKVRDELLLEVVRSIPPLKTNDPPETEDQVALPEELMTLLLKVWIAAELLVMLPVDPTIMSVPVHVYAYAPELKTMPPIDLPAPTSTLVALKPRAPKAAISPAAELVGTALLVQEVAFVQNVPVLFQANTGAGLIVIVKV